jgi:holin-like protein
MKRADAAPARLLQIAGGIGVLALLAASGGLVARLLDIPVPGPVIGMGLYLALLAAVPRAVAWTVAGARLLTSLLGALIVPAAVGLAAFAPVLRAEAAPLAAAVVLSTAATGLATAGAYRLIARMSER